LSDILRKCQANNPDDRYQTVKAPSPGLRGGGGVLRLDRGVGDV
jgi:hypothetical protein